LWNLLSFVASQGAGFVIFLILAMRLPPEIFGVIALAALAADFVAVDGRFAAMDAVIQAGRYDKKSLNSSFMGFFLLAALVAIGMWVAAPFVGSAFNAPLVATFMPLFGLMLLPVPWLAVMDALLTRDLQFRQLTQRNIAGTLAGGAVGIALAFSPWLVWALFAQRLAGLVVTGVLQIFYTRWAPGLAVSRNNILDFLRRFFALWVIGALNLLIGRMTMIVFGMRYDAVTVGLTRAANRIAETIQGPIVSPIMSLWFPLMSKVKGDIAAEREIYNSILRTAAFVVLPAFAGLAITSHDVVALLLPHQYAGVAPLVQATAITYLLVPIVWFNAIAMTALGMNRISLIYTVALVSTSLIGLFAFWKVSPSQALLIMAIPAAVVGIVGNIILNRRLQQSNGRHYAGLAPAILATAAMTAVTFLVDEVLRGSNGMLRLMACVTTGGVTYLGWLGIFHRTWVKDRIALLRGRSSTQI
ncbi:MAG: polysaccharide biosynthesis protein, partial [Alphaproteobacteria bacterium]